jgi:hypothetical protein
MRTDVEKAIRECLDCQTFRAVPSNVKLGTPETALRRYERLHLEWAPIEPATTGETGDGIDRRCDRILLPRGSERQVIVEHDQSARARLRGQRRRARVDSHRRREGVHVERVADVPGEEWREARDRVAIQSAQQRRR